MSLYAQSYLCINCHRRFYKDDVKHIYKRNCVCPNCVNILKMYDEAAMHYAGPNIEYYTPAFVYSQEFRSLFLKFKFQGYTAYGHLLADIAAEHIKKNPNFDEYSYIIPVPISIWRRIERGFNQSELMLEHIANAMDKPVLKCLKRIKHSTPQSKYRRFRSRTRNVKNAYSCNLDFNGDNLILFDDVYTSGSTMYECAKILKKHGAGKITGIACAHSCEIYK